MSSHCTTSRRPTAALAARTQSTANSTHSCGLGASLGSSHPLRWAALVDSTSSAFLPRPGEFISARDSLPALVTTAVNRYLPARCMRSSAVPRPSESMAPSHGPSAASMMAARISNCPTPRRNRAAAVRNAPGVAVI